MRAELTNNQDIHIHIRRISELELLVPPPMRLRRPIPVTDTYSKPLGPYTKTLRSGLHVSGRRSTIGSVALRCAPETKSFHGIDVTFIPLTIGKPGREHVAITLAHSQYNRLIYDGVLTLPYGGGDARVRLKYGA